MKTEKATHTPGPWIVKGDQLFGADGAQIYVRNLGVTIPHYPHAVADANTKLMQTAPELLAEAIELLRNATYADGQATVRTQDCEALEAVIAKATGQTL